MQFRNAESRVGVKQSVAESCARHLKERVETAK